MTDKNKSGRKPPKRYSHHATKRRSVFRPPEHPGRLVAIIAAVLLVVVIALIWGNALKKKSDAYRAAEEAGEWTLPSETVGEHSSVVPEINALEIKPEGNVGDIIIENSHGGVILPLRGADGGLSYRSAIAAEVGLPIPADAPALSDDVLRVSKRGLRVIGVFHVTCFDATDPAVLTYRRGLELALLLEYAASGIDELLILGLPVGDDAGDRLAVDFLTELDSLLSALSPRPAVGVSLPLSALAGEPDESGQTVYAGEISPGRIGQVADYVALDLRNHTAEEIDTLLPDLSYAYMRHRLRMLVDRGVPTIAEDLFSHGFERVFEMKRDT